MSLTEIKQEIMHLPVDEQDELAAYLTAMRLNRNPDFRKELNELKNDENPDNWLTLEELKNKQSE